MSEESFGEPLALLAATHERIAAQLATLEGMIEHVAACGCDAAAQAAAEAVMRYFDTSGRLHQRDEDEDLFPLLRARAGRLGRAEIAAAIDELEREHSTMDGQWARLRERLGAIASARDARLDTEEVARFAWLYRRHMDRERAAVLPFAAEVLSAGERAALGERMAARRELA